MTSVWNARPTISGATAGWMAAVVSAAAFLLFSASASGQSIPAIAGETIGAGDTVKITVFQNPDLTTETRVSDHGSITFPLVGEVNVGGLTPSAAETRIAQRLAQGKFVNKPQVNVNITKVRSRQVTVLGQVARPGRYPLEDPTTSVTDALALAGGITATGADSVVVVVSRDGHSRRNEINVDGMARSGDFSANIPLAAGDTVYVGRAPVFYIYGEVQRAGAYRLESPMTVMQAIAVGGGITPRGTTRGLRIERREADGTSKRINATLTDRLNPDDVVYVAESLF
jgi:polysaccharide biosynthesis/export protein